MITIAKTYVHSSESHMRAVLSHRIVEYFTAHRHHTVERNWFWLILQNTKDTSMALRPIAYWVVEPHFAGGGGLEPRRNRPRTMCRNLDRSDPVPKQTHARTFFFFYLILSLPILFCFFFFTSHYVRFVLRRLRSGSTYFNEACVCRRPARKDTFTRRPASTEDKTACTRARNARA